MQLLIAGDLVPTQSNMGLFNQADLPMLLGKELLALWHAADIRIFNLEAPLVNQEDPIKKFGPNLMVPTSAMNGIKALEPGLITLANNHILDQGEQGLKSTLDLLNDQKIPYVGAGENLSEAGKPYMIEKDGLRIGVYTCAEHEFSIANEKSPGANPFDPLESPDHIKNLKEQCDYVIVLYHGGKEHYRYPSPYLQKVSRKMAEKGADLVIGQHSHCIGCVEKYKESTIVYGQGNFIFDGSDSEYWQTSLLIKIEFKDGCRIEYIPMVKEDNVVRIAEGSIAREILGVFEKRSWEIVQEGFVAKKYDEFAEKNKVKYMTKLSGMGKLLSRIDRQILNNFLIKRKYNRIKVLTIQNYIECEANRELLSGCLKAVLKNARK